MTTNFSFLPWKTQRLFVAKWKIALSKRKNLSTAEREQKEKKISRRRGGKIAKKLDTVDGRAGTERNGGGRGMNGTKLKIKIKSNEHFQTTTGSRTAKRRRHRNLHNDYANYLSLGAWTLRLFSLFLSLPSHFRSTLRPTIQCVVHTIPHSAQSFPFFLFFSFYFLRRAAGGGGGASHGNTKSLLRRWEMKSLCFLFPFYSDIARRCFVHAPHSLIVEKRVLDYRDSGGNFKLFVDDFNPPPRALCLVRRSVSGGEKTWKWKLNQTASGDGREVFFSRP